MPRNQIADLFRPLSASHRAVVLAWGAAVMALLTMGAAYADYRPGQMQKFETAEIGHG
jgi:hypothetical protein